MRLFIIALLALLGILSSLTQEQEVTPIVFWWPQQEGSHSYRIDIHRSSDSMNTGGWFTTNWFANYEEIMCNQKSSYYNLVVISLTNNVPDGKLIETNYNMYWVNPYGPKPIAAPKNLSLEPL